MADDWENAEVVESKAKDEYKDEDNEETKKKTVEPPPQPKKDKKEVDYDQLYQKKSEQYSKVEIANIEQATQGMTLKEKQEFLSKEQDKANIKDLFNPVIVNEVDKLSQSVIHDLEPCLSIEKTKQIKEIKVLKFIEEITARVDEEKLFQENYYEILGNYFKEQYNKMQNDEKEKRKKKAAAKKGAQYGQQDIVKDLFTTQCQVKEESKFNENEDFM